MKNYTKKGSSSPMVLVIPLVIAFVVVVAAAMFGRISTENRSRASFDGVSLCTKACNTKNVRAAKYIKDKAACALDCPSVVAGSMTCGDFCKENVRAAAGTNPTNDHDWSSQGICVNQCKQWVKKGVATSTVSGTPSVTPAASPTFNCTEKCSGIPAQFQMLCSKTCEEFNSKTRSCPSGCKFSNQQMQNTCAQLFCAGQ